MTTWASSDDLLCYALQRHVAWDWPACLSDFSTTLDAGVEKVDIDLASKKVTVRGTVTPEAVKDKVRRGAIYRNGA